MLRQHRTHHTGLITITILIRPQFCGEAIAATTMSPETPSIITIFG